MAAGLFRPLQCKGGLQYLPARVCNSLLSKWNWWHCDGYTNNNACEESFGRFSCFSLLIIQRQWKPDGLLKGCYAIKIVVSWWVRYRSAVPLNLESIWCEIWDIHGNQSFPASYHYNCWFVLLTFVGIVWEAQAGAQRRVIELIDQ